MRWLVRGSEQGSLSGRTLRLSNVRAPITQDMRLAVSNSNAKKLGLYYGGLLAANVVLLIYGSFIPFRFVPMDFPEAIQTFREMFEVAWEVPGTRVDWSVNYLVTLPLGFFGMGTLLAGRCSLARTLLATVLVLSLATALSFGVEFGQVWFAGRVPSLKDVAAQSLGTVTGIAFWLIFGQRFTCWLRSFTDRHAPREKTEWVLQAYVMGFVLYSVLPLDVITTPRELIYKYERGKFELLPFSYQHGSFLNAAYSHITQVLLYLPIGLWTRLAWRREEQCLRSFSGSLFLGLLVALGIETVQAMIVSRYASTTDLILGTVGVALGVFVMGRWRGISATGLEQSFADRQGRLAAYCLLAAIFYAILLPIVFWAPFDFTQDRALIKQRLDDFFSVPFVRMQQGSDMQAIYSSLRMFVWFMPLGALIGAGIAGLRASRPVTRTLAVLGTLAVVAVALGVELGQVLLPQKFADLTDAAICAAGGTFALWVSVLIIGSRVDAGSTSR